ncbi:PREDICTED: E3 ubiquitin-protein ligase MBR2-like [Tarenaya hassleriana]|uniref:E3 ubiquitin-protein ligase MBR2-like n=1 Tax=Tarenaya hassleriana TaxID=28532 RepID=UPI00053C5D08|nr:PREDICTED: E3 ubiquitin-protein ligase MBR2-like [Tarenaya hassleriana]XP_010526956.1 PREDICTED: E3 ubiquitin-protein ligase MBR2-like [Tarenaya hassleriana]XP_010526957.1 PREDICTED: E3 ubiquitin-protein ligase MBR2-like [Tarenaya hassleriana]XP_010526958.1 PREDICTED: E3 ubiquitin-protein ligase MBR2-like [Tarenaya hassleriana]XP_010526959.1 PREDICTED: E3 ubiquitin-protein ligase MBR2-like [Tarenaya hassleriana]XP_010526960.1 PREDICTED: E3 ubiquitin-protein ligase MBR2-like [Tarenaya hassle
MDPMQGPWNTLSSSTEVNNRDGQHISSTNSEALSNNILNPVDCRFPNYSTPSGRSTYVSSGSRDFQSRGWLSSGESSSRLGPSPHQANDVGLKTDHRLASEGVPSHVGYGSEEGKSVSTGIRPTGGLQIGRGGSHVRNGPPFLQGSGPRCMSPTINLGMDMDNNGSCGQSSGAVLCNNNCERSLRSGSQVGEESSGGPGSSLDGGWGTSCKRKALQGASGHSFHGESPDSFVQTENGSWHTQYGASSSNLSLSIRSQSSPNIINRSGQSEPRFGVAVTSNAFPSTRNGDSSSRHGKQLNPGQQQDSVPFSSSSAETSLRSSVSSQQHLTVNSPFLDPLNVRSTPSIGGNSSSSNESQSNIIHLPSLTRNIHHFACNAASSSRSNSSSGQFGLPRESPRSNSEHHHVFVPSTETRNPVLDQSYWSFSRGTPNVSGDYPFAPRAGPSPSIHSLQPNPAWILPPSSSMHNQSRTSELAPWSIFSNVESESESARHGGSLPLLPTGPSVSLNETAVASGTSSRSHRPRPRRSGLLLERQSNLLHLRHLGRRLAADNDARNQLIFEIRQVLNAMRSGENSQFEDYMVFDPLIYHGMAEMHDRHRDMRLDVDSMSYEELLALEERIGDVSTGLSGETIMKAMKQHKYTSSAAETGQDVEPCSVCQEEYGEGDEVGTLDCGHEFHTDCIKQWVMLKNLCPICKIMALST